MSGRCSSWGRLRRARGGSPAGLELASANGSTARVKGESGAESAARVRAAVHAIGSGGARAGRRERRERASGEASTHLEPGQAGVGPLGPLRRSLRRAVARRAGGARMGHAKDSPEPGRGVPEASGARGGRAEPLEKALGGRRKAKRPNVDSRIRAEDPPLARTVVPIVLPGHRVHLLAPPAQDLGAVGGVVDELRWAVESR